MFSYCSTARRTTVAVLHETLSVMDWSCQLIKGEKLIHPDKPQSVEDNCFVALCSTKKHNFPWCFTWCFQSLLPQPAFHFKYEYLIMCNGVEVRAEVCPLWHQVHRLHAVAWSPKVVLCGAARLLHIVNHGRRPVFLRQDWNPHLNFYFLMH